MKILLVEDDNWVGEAISHALKKNSFAVNWVSDGAAAISTLSVEKYSLVLLDLGLPLKSGFDVLSFIKKSQIDSYTIIITARDSVNDKIKGLDAGADDYLVKPFSLEELNARIRAITRRGREHLSNTISVGTIQLDTETKTALYKEKTIELTAKEYALLYEFVSRPGAIISRKQLEEKLYGWNEEISSNAIEFLIHSLRKKLSKEIIKNIRGLGWMIQKN